MHSHPYHTPHTPPESPPVRITADSMPSIAALIRQLSAGHALDEMVAEKVFGLEQLDKAHGISASWGGLRKIVERLTALGCFVQMQVHADRSFCEVLRVLEGAAVAKQLAVADAPALPEAVAKAALLACLEMEPPA